MPKNLHQETLDNHFSVEDTARIDTYIDDAMKNNLQPEKNFLSLDFFVKNQQELLI